MTAESALEHLTQPAGGVPDVLTTPSDLNELCGALEAGHGPLALDAERASGYRYSQRAYLIQGRRAGVGSFLIDPIALPDLSSIAHACGDAEWVIHAASQDLPCLREVGLTPPAALFDTELGGRLAGFERVGLAAMVAQCLGLHLAKEHSAVDWSTRPLPQPWLQYAALDVEVLLELRDCVWQALVDQGKADWAVQEFDHARGFTPAVKVDPWRRTSGSHLVRHPRQQAILREIWQSRDELAQERDISPGRLLSDKAIVAAIRAKPSSVDDLREITGFSGPNERKLAGRWFAAMNRGRKLPSDQWPEPRRTSPSPMPPPRQWADKKPAAAKRLLAAKAALADFSEQRVVPVENVLQPEALRRLCWDPSSDHDTPAVAQQMTDLGARPWQVAACAALFTHAWQQDK